MSLSVFCLLLIIYNVLFDSTKDYDDVWQMVYIQLVISLLVIFGTLLVHYIVVTDTTAMTRPIDLMSQVGIS